MMKKIIAFGLAGLMLTGCTPGPVRDVNQSPASAEAPALPPVVSEKPDASDDAGEENISSPAPIQSIQILMEAYPDDVVGVEEEGDDIWVIMASGDRILYDDRREKSFEEMLEDADIEDMMSMAYPLEPADGIADEGQDPGRIRCYAFFDAVYGASREEIEGNLVNVEYGDDTLMVNGKAGAAKALEQAAKEIAAYVEDHPEVYSYAYPSSGAYYYRTIYGTDRLSPHSYGIAVDMPEHPDDYWEKAPYEAGAARLEGYPLELVEIFEKNGFIWGGKWHHFDLLHFEYRPELLLKKTAVESIDG